MSDLRHQAGPDLHAIFGIDGAPEGVVDPVISLGRGAEDLTAHSSSAELGLDARSEAGIEATLEPAHQIEVESAGEPIWETDEPDSIEQPEAPAAGAPEPDWSGITRPSRRGSSPRF